jgi:hypothetical protein
MEAVEWRQQGESKDGNRTMVAWEIIDSNNKIYLTISNK